MIRCGVSLKERQRSTEKAPLGIKAIVDVTRICSHGNVERKDGAEFVKACTRLVVEGKALVGKRRKIWQNMLC